MPRRTGIARKTKYEQAPANRTTVRFHAKLMSDGKRRLAERILRQALARAEFQAKRPGLEVMEAALRNATPIIEVKPRCVGGATYQVPVEVPARRARTLAVRWLVEFARARGEKSMSERLANEILDAAKQQGNAWKRKDDIYRMAQANKAFAHYRW
jgi:small subunit ribosomal protein S7